MLIIKWLKVCYAAMMFSEKRKSPEGWQNRMVYVFNYYIFFIFASIFSNILMHFKVFSKDDKLYIYGVMGILAIVIFNSNKKWILNYLRKNDVSKNYKKNKTKELFCLILFFLSFLLFLGLFIFSHRIQNYI
ncbi:hypothetical protein [Aquimarina pacifica]|uniref:hypothetical protein n=1 Tax=Aquimarina pacifica TaxID=1296415 RepID=UPI00047119F1|nr:hypothetical protein [Aquimarina pacifica]